MIIASFNIKHNIFRNNKKTTSNIIDIIEKNRIDVLCLQEIPRSLARCFKRNMIEYSVNGDSRYHYIFKLLPFNEKIPIITKNEVLFTKTIRYNNKINNVYEFFKYLFHIPIFSRIATIAIIKVNDEKELCIINTHLDYKLKIMQEKQLNHLIEIINEYKEKYDIVLTGDFNMDESDEHFIRFINMIKSSGLNKTSINGYTWKGKNNKERTLDYIFVSSGLKLKNCGLIKSNNLSDHEIVYVNID